MVNTTFGLALGRVTPTHKFQSKWMGCHRIWKLPLVLTPPPPPPSATARLGEAGWDRKRCSREHEGTRGRTDTVIVGSSLRLCKQLCVLPVHTRVFGGTKNRGMEASIHHLNFTRQGKMGVNGWLETQAAGLVGTLHPGKPSTQIIRGTIEDLLLKINFPMEQKECQASETKATHLNHECHS